eukprot:m.52446 g.52446  ORF g.52446 m.52446 type:complete len:124 (-) comp10792_c1_seq1:164-535(-)
MDNLKEPTGIDSIKLLDASILVTNGLLMTGNFVRFKPLHLIFLIFVAHSSSANTHISQSALPYTTHTNTINRSLYMVAVSQLLIKQKKYHICSNNDDNETTTKTARDKQTHTTTQHCDSTRYM